MALHSVRAIVVPSPKDVQQSISPELRLTQEVEYRLLSPQGPLTQSVSHIISLGGVVNSNSFFLTVSSEDNFEAIVDIIWDNMRGWNRGWKNKDELRSGLLAFMRGQQ